MARAHLLRRVPFTITATLAILGLALASRGLWDPLADRELGRSAAYGLPAFEDGHVWTLATGAVFALQPVQYIAPGQRAQTQLGPSALQDRTEQEPPAHRERVLDISQRAEMDC